MPTPASAAGVGCHRLAACTRPGMPWVCRSRRKWRTPLNTMHTHAFVSYHRSRMEATGLDADGGGASIPPQHRGHHGRGRRRRWPPRCLAATGWRGSALMLAMRAESRGFIWPWRPRPWSCRSCRRRWRCFDELATFQVESRSSISSSVGCFSSRLEVDERQLVVVNRLQQQARADAFGVHGVSTRVVPVGLLPPLRKMGSAILSRRTLPSLEDFQCRA